MATLVGFPRHLHTHVRFCGITELAIYLIQAFIRVFLIGGAVVALLVWLLPQLAEMGILPTLVGAIPVLLVLWAVLPAQQK
jgi:hypothetical protein